MTRPADWLPPYRLADYEREIAAATHGEAQGGTLPGARPPASGGDLTSYQSGDRLAAWLDSTAGREFTHAVVCIVVGALAVCVALSVVL